LILNKKYFPQDRKKPICEKIDIEELLYFLACA